MREKGALDQIYLMFDEGGDGVHSFDEFEMMFRHVDPNITTRACLAHFNQVLDIRRKKIHRAQEEALMDVENEEDGEGEEGEEGEEEEEEDDDEKQMEWESSVPPRAVMLYHTMLSNESLVELNASMVRRLVDGSEERKFDPKEILCNQGDVGDGMYVVEEGEVIVLKLNQENKQGSGLVRVASCSIGDLIGEMVGVNFYLFLVSCFLFLA